MQGLHVFDPQATTIIDLESFVHHEHFLRKVDRVLESAFVRELTTNRRVVRGNEVWRIRSL
jgi:hypothetical protein